jgi:secondary thiamine-phosphate synthase enzyme
MVSTHRHAIRSRGQGDVVDLTAAVSQSVAGSGLKSGIVTVFVVGSTAGITTLELEDGVVADLDRCFERLAPRHADYQHHQRWGDDNGSSHVRAALLGPSITVPFENGVLLLGTWQQVALVELDTRGRQREIVMQVIGE